MASTSTFHSIITLPINSSKCCKNQNFAINPSQFLSSKSILKLKKQTLLSTIQIKKLKNQNGQATPVVFALQSNLFKAWKVGKDTIEAGTSLVPDSIPRPIARISVGVVAGTLALFVLKSFLSTAFFVLAMMGVIYFTFIAFNKDESSTGDKGTTSSSEEGDSSLEDSLEEARRIMEKYK